MGIKITNTLSGKRQPLTPQRPNEVGLYVCGMTVYDLCHLGHARSAIVFDVIRNYLEYKGFHVRFVKNFTDVDDKIIHRANQEGCDFKEIVDRYIAAYEKDMARLRVRPPTLAPKATGHIPEMIALIESLIAKGVAYAISGNVYFEVARFSSYGKLSGRNLDEMIAGGGGRVEVDENKKNPLDFALWKAAKPNEPFWESPWGPGRPGWHIECSAMAIKHLGQTIDLHGGGSDLIFPHHENEIAQSEAYTGKPFVQGWIHHGHVTIHAEKMSKSLGNFFTIDEIFEKSNPFSEAIVADVLRYYLLSTHYRSPIDFSDASLAEAKAGLDNFYTLFEKLEEQPVADNGSREDDLSLRFRTLFEEAMDDDFNTAKAIAVLQQFRSEANLKRAELEKKKETGTVRNTFRAIGNVLGLFQVPVSEWRYVPWKEATAETLGEEEMLQRVRQREEARKAGDFAMSDRIRAELSRAGYILEDRPDGSTRVKR